MNRSLNYTGNYTSPGWTKQQLLFVDSVAVVFLPVVLTVGLLGNTLVIAVFQRSRATAGHSYNMAFVAICVMDTVALLFGTTWNGLRLYIRYYSGIRVPALFETPLYAAFMTCLYLLEPWAATAGTWIECYLSIARFTAVYWPHRARILFGYSRTKQAVVILVVLALLGRVPFWVVELHALGVRGMVRRTMTVAEPILKFVFQLFVPMLIITVTTAGIIRVLQSSRKQFAEIPRARAASVQQACGEYPSGNLMQCADAKSVGRSSSPTCAEIAGRRGTGEGLNHPWNFNLVRITFVLVGKNLSYFIFLTTYILIDLIYLANGRNQPGETLIAAYTLSYMLSYVHHCTSLFICLAGGKRFRQQTVELCRSVFHPCRVRLRRAAARAARNHQVKLSKVASNAMDV